MSDKRTLAQMQPVQTKRQEVEKKVSKPGRKPINSEPKNKRTAQNRAAQRAFRERKERKMKELEDKVSELESEKKAVATESEFLRMQVEMLSKELRKYKGSEFDPRSMRNDKAFLEYFKNATPAPTATSSFEFPWKRKDHTSLFSESLGLAKASLLLPGTSSGSLPSDVEPSKKNEIPDLTNELDPHKEFDEKVFCESLNMACGTIDKPIPKTYKATPPAISSNPSKNSLVMQPDVFTPSSSAAENLDLFDLFGGEPYDSNVAFGRIDDFDFFKDDTFGYRDSDPNMLFENNDFVDPVQALTTEELQFDAFRVPLVPLLQDKLELPMSKYINSNGNSPATFTELPKSGDEFLDDDNAVVPAREKDMIKCSEIWDRVTSHPKYSELDIDGLCSELRAKAKCSEKGALVKTEDFEKIMPK